MPVYTFENICREKKSGEIADKKADEIVEKKTLESVRNFILKTELSDETIAECCSISVDEVAEIRKNLRNKN